MESWLLRDSFRTQRPNSSMGSMTRTTAPTTSTRQLQAGDEHQDQPAGQGHQIAQGQRHRGAHHRLDQGGVGGHARQHFAGAGDFEELRRQAQHIVEHRLADIGHHPLAQPGDGIEAGRRGQPQHGRRGDERQVIMAKAFGLAAERSCDRSAPARKPAAPGWRWTRPSGPGRRPRCARDRAAGTAGRPQGGQRAGGARPDKRPGSTSPRAIYLIFKGSKGLYRDENPRTKRFTFWSHFPRKTGPLLPDAVAGPPENALLPRSPRSRLPGRGLRL